MSPPQEGGGGGAPHLGENANEMNGTTLRFNYAFSGFPLKMSSGLNANVTKRQTLAGRQKPQLKWKVLHMN